ncbi:MAG: prepilin-type N-terminal cleavage/methylation domain-containing protein [Rickettsiales bacterium]|nr:prepilin-type N-terminal cleavage/methylation domain-containing protein [Pseudomonadota bacterium]MDA0965881.1 prepilin-type N-terminal cleavage/methylation domain-containing protein [Pseudomonadota bacterium]MDG4542649.1 prepilin-type N-terminal cleavage/methylation domain-containing protein [Rickettsiales bacterium]MDG4545153.1 prepilin-type N-terminal cleavage/methylation domain-containing protein [Rickettsiales bacterium]MDG4547276.1 prepilin-type N-terminal cleavage/methylation domain-c
MNITRTAKERKYGVKTENGFTLIELSMVIVIIGLIVAGIVGGQDLVQHSRILSQVSDLKKYEIAYNTFKLQFNAIPGDFNKASQYWSGVQGGNGNNMLNEPEYGYDNSYENLKFFQHLSEATLINESYNNTFVLGGGYPKLKIDDTKGMVAAGYQVLTGSGAFLTCSQLNNSTAHAIRKAALYMNVGVPGGGGGYNDVLGVSSPKVMQAIDKKIDDGFANKGRFRGFTVIAFCGQDGNCLDGVNGDYLVSNNLKPCVGEYILEGEVPEN